MTTQETIIRLSRWLGSHLSEDIVLPPSVEDYVSGTFGTTDLKDIFETADSSDIESLLELLLYPEIDIMERFEAQWGMQRFVPQDIDALIAAVCERAIRATITAPAENTRMCMTLPSFAIEAFIVLV